MSAALPRSKKNKFAQPISHSSEESKRKKNNFVGTGISPKCKGTRSKGRQEEEAVQAHVRIFHDLTVFRNPGIPHSSFIFSIV